MLVALLVLSIGLLGLAALQTTGLQFNHQSYERTQAVIQAYDIIDRMRANKSGDGATINTAYNSVALGTLPVVEVDCTVATCTGDQMAAYDIYYWNAANASILVEGKGAICKGTYTNDTNNYPTGCTQAGSIYKVAVAWKEKDLYLRLDVETQP
ncbi:MAG: type IV pilus modification protein PilV [Gammaproteobacteria bacterium]|nr:type IV pilus modification protein PilV [Gammaproteobacteria bacterium]